MRKEDWDKGLNEIDPEIVEEFIDKKARYAGRGRGKLMLRIIAIAACVCVIIATVVLVPMALRGDKDNKLDLPDETTTDTESQYNPDQWHDILWGTVATEADTSSGTSADTESSGAQSTESAPVTDTNKYAETTQGSTTDKPQLPGENQNTANALDKVNNGVLKDASPKKMDVPENIKNLGTSDATEENNADKIKATTISYKLDGDVVNWATEDDILYVITKGNNRLVVIDSKTMQPTYNVPLAAVPAEMNIIGDEVYISLPDLCRIDIFAKVNGDKTGSIYFDHEVSSFCIDGDYIYYSEHDQWCKVYKKDLTTGTIRQVELYNTALFYEPKIYLNKEDRILCVGESGFTGSSLYYFDADTLALKSFFQKDDYGIMNNTREIFHVGNDIFWGSYRISDTNAKELIGRYGEMSYGGTVYACDELVSTGEGLFLTDTYECIINYFEADFDYDAMIISDSYNVFFRDSGFNSHIIIGVNLEIQ